MTDTRTETDERMRWLRGLAVAYVRAPHNSAEERAAAADLAAAVFKLADGPARPLRRSWWQNFLAGARAAVA